MATKYRPEQLPEILSKTERALEKIEALIHPQHQQRLSFFHSATDRQIELAEQQLEKILQHIHRLDDLQDHYFSSALKNIPIAKENSTSLFYDEFQILKGRLEANILMTEKLLGQKTPDDLQSLRFLTNQLTAQKESLKQMKEIQNQFVQHHSNESMRNGHRIDLIKLRTEKLRDLLPSQESFSIARTSQL